MWSELRPRLRGVYYALTNRAIPIHRQEKNEPFFIVGSGRCGTTLLRRILQASPEVHIPPENWGIGHVIRSFRQNRWLLDWNQLVEITVAALQYRTHDWFEDIDHPEKLLKELKGWSESEKSLYHLVDRLYRYHGESVEAEFHRWGDKTPWNINQMGTILDAFPDVRFINLVRDGVDVVHSWSRHEQYDGDVVEPARRWKDAVIRGRAFARWHPDHILEVRYERLVRKPEEAVRDVCRFLDLSYDHELLERTDHYEEIEKAQSVVYFENAFESITDKNIGKGRRNLTVSQKEEIAPIINDTLARFEYQSVGL